MAYLAAQRCSLGCFSRWSFFLWLATCSAVFAQPSGCNPTTEPTAPGSGIQTEAEDPSEAGLRAFIDPQTGEFVPEPPPGTAPTVDATAAELRPELVEEIRPDGSVMIRLDDRFQKPLKAEVTDGELVTCHGDPNQHD